MAIRQPRDQWTERFLRSLGSWDEDIPRPPGDEPRDHFAENIAACLDDAADAQRYAETPVQPHEFASDQEDLLGLDADGWEPFKK